MTTQDANQAAYQAWLATPEGQAAVNKDVAATETTSVGGEREPQKVPEAPLPAAAPVEIDYDKLAAAIGKTGTDAAPEPPADKAPVSDNQFMKGNLVRHEWVDPYSGKTQSRLGIVVDTHPDTGTGAGSSVAWLDGPSGAIGDQNLSAV